MRPSQDEESVEIGVALPPEWDAVLAEEARQRGVSLEQVIADLTMERLADMAGNAVKRHPLGPMLRVVK